MLQTMQVIMYYNNYSALLSLLFNRSSFPKVTQIESNQRKTQNFIKIQALDSLISRGQFPTSDYQPS